MYHDTELKGIVRNEKWSITKDHLGSEFYSGAHSFLSSRYCGDGFWLADNKVRPDRIIAVEKKYTEYSSLCHMLNEKGLLWIARHEDIVDTVRWLNAEKEPHITTYLDYCGNLNAPVVETTQQVVRLLGKHRQIFSVSISCGRDPMHSMQERNTTLDRLVSPIDGKLIQRTTYINVGGIRMITATYCIGKCGKKHTPNIIHL